MAQDADKGKVFLYVCLQCGSAIGCSILMTWHTDKAGCIQCPHTVHKSCECVTSKLAPLPWTALSANILQQYQFISLSAYTHDMQSIEGSWNISLKGCELVVFFTEDDLIAEMNVLRHFISDSSPTFYVVVLHKRLVTTLWMSIICHPSLLCLECIVLCSVHSIHIKNLDEDWKGSSH